MKTDARLEDFMAACQRRVEQALEQWLPPERIPPEKLHSAMRYAALGGGKRIRPILVYATGTALAVDHQHLDGPACAIELIHAYSLIHDDLPAMDDDDLRRGKPTCHKAFDEATAILAGDALQTLAFQVLATDPLMEADLASRLSMVEILARASGSRGMAGGQALDLEAIGRDIDLAQLENTHIHKTGALIRSCVRLATLSQPQIDPKLGHKLDHFAKCIGLAFQIRDDILDVEGETEVIGKTRGKDQAQNKPTYPTLLGLAEAREKAETLCEEARNSLQPFGDKADILRGIADYIVGRNH